MPKGNPRRGAVKGYRGQKGGAHQRPWREDPVILGRIHAGLKPWLEHKTAAECLVEINKWLAENHPDEPPIRSVDTIFDDRNRAMELRREQATNAAETHLAELDHTMREAWQAFHDAKDGSLNRSAYLSLIANAVEKKAKLDGSLVARSEAKVDASVAVEGGSPILSLTPAQLGEACAVLYGQSEEFRLAFDAKLGKTVVEMPAPYVTPIPAEAARIEPPQEGVVDFRP